MGGESYRSSWSSLEGEDSRMGSQRDLINIRGAQLYLIDGEESVLMMSGEFSLTLLKQTHSPLAVVVANVGEVQWPIGKDAPVLKVWNRRYTFALPGLVYGMILPDSTPIAVLHRFEAILIEYSPFEIHHEIADAVQLATSGRRDDPGFWTAVAQEVETLNSRVARNIDSTSTIVASSIVMGGDWVALGMEHGATWMKRKSGRPESPTAGGDGGVSPRMKKRMQQARRMSAVAKLMSRTLLKGAISATGHVSRSLSLDVNATSAAPAYGSPDDTPENVAVASVDAFAKVVEAVEMAGQSLYDASQKLGTDIVQERFGLEAGHMLQDGFGAVGDVINTAWTLNKMGVKMLLRMTAATTVLSTRIRKSKSATSTVTDEQSFSSCMSTGSMPMKQQYSPPQSLQHEISLSPQHVARSNPLHLLSPANVHTGQQLHTSQLFPTSAEQMKNQVTVGVQPTSPMFMATANYTGIVPPVPRRNSPFQQYHWNVPKVEKPFSFQPARSNMQIE